MTRTIPITEFKVRLSRLFKDIVNKNDEIIITRNGKPAAVLLSAEEYEGWKETQDILSDPDAVAEIQRNLDAIQKGNAKTYTVDELFGPDIS